MPTKLLPLLLILPCVGWSESPTLIDTSTGFFRIGYDRKDTGFRHPVSYMVLDGKGVRVPKCNNNMALYNGKTLTCPTSKPSTGDKR